MKKILSVLVTLAGLLATGCVENEVIDVNAQNSDYIGFSATTTRAGVSDVDDMREDAIGFRVYATSGDAPSGWYSDGEAHIDGNNHHRWNGDKWRFAKQVKWPEADGYPMKFYAMYPAYPAGLGTLIEDFSPVTLSVPYTIQSTAASQVDLLAAQATAGNKPVSSSLSMTFRHILSKVDVGIIAGEGVDVQVQSIGVVNVGETRTYDLVSGEWKSAATGSASYGYSLGAPDNHLMLMPQTSASWSPVGGSTPTGSSGGYISVIYRMSTGNGTNGTGDPREVGFADAAGYPGGSGGVTGALFVKAGFPLASSDFAWEAGKSYTYNLGLGTHGSCNGYILDEYYYDNSGNRTNLKLVEVLNEGKRVGDKLQDGTIRVSLTTDDWGEAGDNMQPAGTIKVSPDVVRLPHIQQYPAPQTLNVICRDGAGAADNTMNWTLASSDPWLTLSLDPHDIPAVTVSGIGNKTVYLVHGANNTGSIRTAQIYLNGNTVNAAATVCQNMNIDNITGGGTQPAGVTTYVGAFWKHDQTGERIIRIQAGVNSGNYGTWSASVAWMDGRWGAGDGVVLAPGDSNDPNIRHATNTPGDAEYFKVTGGFDYISGSAISASNQYITFRIGLKSEYRPTTQHPARYAVLIINYANGNKQQKIFLRQGEYDDYLMTNADPVDISTGISNRTQCVRFSPYNLTASTLNKQLDLPGTTGTNPGRFTDYPTQAGGFFQWSYNKMLANPDLTRYAWNPGSASASTWINNFWLSNVWSVISGEQESCPAGYRRPTDGPVNTIAPSAPVDPGMAVSEMRQSLCVRPFINPNHTVGGNTDNSVWGYYADGFFDRRPITSGTTVAGDNSIAYVGRLFFNPHANGDHRNASLFFPAAGNRNMSTGNLMSAGIEGKYWSSTTITNISPGDCALNMTFAQGDMEFWIAEKSFGHSIRCVRNNP